MKTLCVLISLFSVVTCRNILGLFPFGAKSHFIVFDSLMVELANRGYNVTVVSPFVPKYLPDHYTSISVGSTKNTHSFPFDEVNYYRYLILFQTLDIILPDIEGNSQLFLQNEVMHSVFNTSYDLVFVELFNGAEFSVLANKLGAPVIGLSSGYPQSWSLSSFGVPQELSYIPCFTVGFSKRMTLVEKLLNVFIFASDIFLHKLLLDPRSQKIIEDQFMGNGVSVEDATKNISMFFLNTHFTFHGGRPFPPQVVEVGGLHVQPVHPLPEELDKWMNESTTGVIYFSFGSMLRGATLPTDKVKAFLEVFETLPQRVLWKWEDDNIEDLPRNVKIMKWLPQRDILAHPKVKVFISHGGLLGTTEAVVSAVPILGIPMYGDQPNNVAALVENKVAIHVDYNNISVASLSYALKTLINDKSYSENAKELSRRFLDRPQSPLDTAVYWTEYVIRHRGAPHLQSAAVHLPWYQYYLLDVIAVLTAALLVLLAFVYYTIKSCLRLVLPKRTTKLKRN